MVCRGGNLALNIAPQPDGNLPAAAVRAADGLGGWLRGNGEAIYGTRTAEPWEAGNTAFTRKGSVVYALVKIAEGEKVAGEVAVPWPGEVRKMTLLCTGDALPFRRTDEGYSVGIPRDLQGQDPAALAIRMEK